ncbi:unnamed protein product [Laminaria digitata]
MSNSCEKMIDFRPCNKFVRVANGTHLPIEGHGNLVADFQSGQNSVRLNLIDVAYSPRLSYHLFSGPACVKQGHTYLGDHRGITVKTQVWRVAAVPFGRNLVLLLVQACAVITAGLLPTTDVDVNAYHRSTAHTHHRLLLRSAEQQGVKLKKGSKLLPCVGCSMAKGISAPVNKVTECRSDKKLGRVFVDLSGKKAVKSKGGNQYAMIFRDDKTRLSWAYFLRSKAEAPDMLEQWLTDIRLHGIPGIIRSDDASELKVESSMRFAGNIASSKSLHRRIGRS